MKVHYVCPHLYGNTVYQSIMVDRTLTFATLRCVLPSTAGGSTFVAYWSDHLDAAILSCLWTAYTVGRMLFA